VGATDGGVNTVTLSPNFNDKFPFNIGIRFSSDDGLDSDTTSYKAHATAMGGNAGFALAAGVALHERGLFIDAYAEGDTRSVNGDRTIGLPTGTIAGSPAADVWRLYGSYIEGFTMHDVGRQRTEIDGFELLVDYMFSDTFVFGASYATTNGRFDSDRNGIIDSDLDRLNIKTNRLNAHFCRNFLGSID
jgi:hypothetical protein